MMDEGELEQDLRAALRPVAAPDGLAERIISKAEARSRRPLSQNHWLRWAALAATLTIGTFGLMRWNEKRQADRIEARRVAEQFTLAMNITSRKISQLQKTLVVNIPLSFQSEGQ